jgi:hypothetical protein
MSSPPEAAPEDIQVISVVPILRMYDVAATIAIGVRSRAGDPDIGSLAG